MKEEEEREQQQGRDAALFRKTHTHTYSMLCTQSFGMVRVGTECNLSQAQWEPTRPIAGRGRVSNSDDDGSGDGHGDLFWNTNNSNTHYHP